MSFYTFNQNNSGGGFDVDDVRGIGHYVIVEADNAEQANKRAEEIGLYFDGVEYGPDCGCCGDRWYEVYDGPWSEADKVPSIYGTPVESYDFTNTYFNDVAFVHYANGPFIRFGGIGKAA